MRFALKSRRGPHFPIASDAPKHLRKEIERRLDVVKDIKLHPVLVKEDEDIDLDKEEPLYSHVYRMKAVDSLKFVEEDIVRVTKDPSRRKPPGQDVRFLPAKTGERKWFSLWFGQQDHQFLRRVIHSCET